MRRNVANFIGETDFLAGKLLALGEGGRATVETPIGRFEGVMGDASARPAVGAAVTVSIRPECWKLERVAPARNAVRGRIGQAVYLGELAQYEFESGGTKLKMLELNPRFAGPAARGELFASVEPEDVVVLLE